MSRVPGSGPAAPGAARAAAIDRLALTEDVFAACPRVEPVHSPIWDVQPEQPLLPVAHTPPPIAAWPSKTTSGCMLLGR